MALCPFADHKLIRPGSNDPRIEVIGAILHVDAGNARSLYNYFNGPSGGIESHFHIALDGTIEQYRNTGYEADANLKANSFWQDGRRKGFVSIETQGYGAGKWTPEQLASIKRLLRWLSQVHDFPLRETPTPFSPGVGYHTLHGAPSAWTPVAKSCPGWRRKRQFRRVPIPWMRNPHNESEEDDDMSWSEEFRNFKSEGGWKQPAKNWLLRAFNNAKAGRIAANHAHADAQRARAHAEANGKKLDTLLDRSLTDAQRAKRLDQIADDLAAKLAKIEVKVTAEVQAAENS